MVSGSFPSTFVFLVAHKSLFRGEVGRVEMRGGGEYFEREGGITMHITQRMTSPPSLRQRRLFFELWGIILQGGKETQMVGSLNCSSDTLAPCAMVGYT